MKRNPTDYRDEIEHAKVAAILAALPEDHLARIAYREHETTIALAHLVADRPGLVERFKTAYLEGWGRIMDRCRGFRPA